MPVLAANAVPVAANWTGQAIFRWSDPARPLVKLDVNVSGADVIAQVSEEDSGAFMEDANQEMLLRVGFSSRVFASGFTAVRFKVWAGTVFTDPAFVDITLYA